MTTKLRTGLLLVFTAMTASAALSGCIIETTSGPPKTTCAESRYFQVYWSVANDPASQPFTCSQTPAYVAEVQLDTSTGTYRVGKRCQATNYMGFVFDFSGETQSAIPTGTYVNEAHLVGTDGSSLSIAPGAGSAYQMPSCAPMEVAYTFDLN
jgi:hypothetical protein